MYTFLLVVCLKGSDFESGRNQVYLTLVYVRRGWRVNLMSEDYLKIEVVYKMWEKTVPKQTYETMMSFCDIFFSNISSSSCVLVEISAIYNIRENWNAILALYKMYVEVRMWENLRQRLISFSFLFFYLFEKKSNAL